MHVQQVQATDMAFAAVLSDGSVVASIQAGVATAVQDQLQYL